MLKYLVVTLLTYNVEVKIYMRIFTFPINDLKLSVIDLDY